VENRAGGGGTIGYEAGISGAGWPYAHHDHGDLRDHPSRTSDQFDALNDCTPIIGRARPVRDRRPSSPPARTTELVALAKPSGTDHLRDQRDRAIVHLATSYTAGAQMTHVPYKAERRP
jgi:tripartite-type tricarboxylate transporter receptor subunit TctC